MSVRKAHNSGRNHLRNVVDYYQRKSPSPLQYHRRLDIGPRRSRHDRFVAGYRNYNSRSHFPHLEIGHEKAQSVIDSITSSYAAEGQAHANPMLPQNQPGGIAPGLGPMPGPGGMSFPPPGAPGAPPFPFPMPGMPGMPPFPGMPGAPGAGGPPGAPFMPPGPGGRGVPPMPPFPGMSGAGGVPPFPPPGGLPFPPPGGFPFPPPGQGFPGMPPFGGPPGDNR